MAAKTKKSSKLKLTVLDIKFENLVARTPAGMAHWAGTGPEGKTCRECSNYVFNGYTSSKVSNGGALKKGPCQKYVDRFGKGKNFPFETSSCKYFEQNKNPPTITDQRKK